MNCQGLRKKDKRYIWRENQKCDILFIQDSHFTNKNIINSETKCKIYHSFGNSISKGVSNLIKDNINQKNNK